MPGLIGLIRLIGLVGLIRLIGQIGLKRQGQLMSLICFGVVISNDVKLRCSRLWVNEDGR